MLILHTPRAATIRRDKKRTAADALYQRIGDIGAVHYQLGHKNQQTSRIYVHSIATKPDKYGSLLDDAFGL